MRRLGSLLVLFVLLGSIWLFVNRQMVMDTVVAQKYDVPSEMTQIGNDITLTDQATFLLDASQAQIADQSLFNAKCQKREQNSVVLGCYIHPHELYVYRVTDSRLSGVVETTTAHELLHAVYLRLDDQEKKRINTLLEKSLPEALRDNPSLQKRIELYDRIEPGERLNELHSIIGTEVTSIPSSLEEHYKKYFKDRAKVVSYAKKYTAIFQELQSQQAAIAEYLKQLAQQITREKEAYAENIQALNSDINAFNKRAQQLNGFSSESEYNNLRSSLLNRSEEMNTARQDINQMIDTYNEKRDELQALNIEVDELNSKLDSSTPLQL